ncbi:hypothetical protein EDC50_0339 [Vulcaniibacterium tengchongense]|uniref:Uncharacterized protein n=2 Tax=Vulcaniibacterium tengchongense TaxID=1273429 RepID=A0A3N4VVT9_9GAMM|nr:hypothetical protein EDC50_0339 [Vulcaniibacterium tengchongense]
MRMSCLGLLAGALGIGAAAAQDPGKCPQLPPDSGLTWEHRGTADSDFCRALRADGSEAFGLYIAAKTPFEPKRGDRAEPGVIDGQEIYWYRAELAGKPDVQARETLVRLDDGRTVHIWLQAPDPNALAPLLQQAQSMRLPSTRLSSK